MNDVLGGFRGKFVEIESSSVFPFLRTELRR